MKAMDLWNTLFSIGCATWKRGCRPNLALINRREVSLSLSRGFSKAIGERQPLNQRSLSARETGCKSFKFTTAQTNPASCRFNARADQKRFGDMRPGECALDLSELWPGIRVSDRIRCFLTVRTGRRRKDRIIGPTKLERKVRHKSFKCPRSAASTLRKASPLERNAKVCSKDTKDHSGAPDIHCTGSWLRKGGASDEATSKRLIPIPRIRTPSRRG